jgi:carbon starvation protein CstA
MGEIPGVIALFGTFMIMVIILAVLALIVVKALTGSPWGTFTVMATIPIALFMGVYSRLSARPHRRDLHDRLRAADGWPSSAASGCRFADPGAPMFTFTGTQLTWMLIGYGFIASVIPVWLLLAPRDYLSTFLKIGTIVALAIGILSSRPHLQMPAVTRFIDGTGPVWSGSCSRSCSSPSPAAPCPASTR